MGTSISTKSSPSPECSESMFTAVQYVDVQACDIPSSEAETPTSVDSDCENTVDPDEEQLSRELSAVTISEVCETEESVELRNKRAFIHHHIASDNSNDHLTKCIKHVFNNLGGQLDADDKADQILDVMFPNLSSEIFERLTTGKKCSLYRSVAIIKAIIHENTIDNDFFLLCIAAAYGGCVGIKRFLVKWNIGIRFQKLRLCNRDQCGGLKGLIVKYFSIIGHVLIFMRNYPKGRSYFSKHINKNCTRQVTLEEIGKVTLWEPVIFNIATRKHPRQIKKQIIREYETMVFPFNQEIVDEIINALFGFQVDYK